MVGCEEPDKNAATTCAVKVATRIVQIDCARTGTNMPAAGIAEAKLMAKREAFQVTPAAAAAAKQASEELVEQAAPAKSVWALVKT